MEIFCESGVLLRSHLCFDCMDTLSIVKNADQILVVSDGRITESGTHDELLERKGKYAAMWNAEQKIST